jgi:predicted transcriptional regulator
LLHNIALRKFGAPMKFVEYQEKIDSLIKLAKHSNTGTPKELAKRLNISERTVYRLIQNLNDQNIEINFCRKVKSYILKN